MDVADAEMAEKQLDAMLQRIVRASQSYCFARTLGVEQSELISRLDTFATKKRKA